MDNKVVLRKNESLQIVQLSALVRIKKIKQSID